MIKEIQIRRHEPNSYLPAQVIADAKRKLGSVFVNSAPLRGLTHDEEEKYMPLVIGISAKSNEFAKKLSDYWKDFTIEIPHSGIVLNIGLNEKNEPINLTDWIKWRWVILHPFVAESKHTMVGQKRFYIYDPAQEAKRTNAKIGVKKAAYREFLKVSEDPKTMARIIRVLGKRNPIGMTSEEHENMLGQIIETDPEGFFKVATDKNLEMQDLVLQLTEVEILRKVGASYLYHDTVIGNTMEEAILFMRNSSNSLAIAEMKAKLLELSPSNKTGGGVTEEKPKPEPTPIESIVGSEEDIPDQQSAVEETKEVSEIDFELGDASDEDVLADLIPDSK